MTAEHRSRAARVAIYTRLATADRKEMTAPARAAAMDRFEKQVDQARDFKPDIQPPPSGASN